MKSSIPALFATVVTTSVAVAQTDLPLGIEAVTGTRSEYIDRGFKKAQQILDFQLEGEVTLDEDLYLGYGAWFATSTGSDDFSETGTKLALTYDMDDWQWRGKLIYRSLNQSEFDSGLEATSEFSYFFPESEKWSHQLSGILSYDSGADGLYGAVEYNNYYTLNSDVYFSYKLGASAAVDYYDVDGANDIYSRVSLTYNITKQVSITPFLFTSITVADDDRSNFLGAGIWFEMSF